MKTAIKLAAVLSAFLILATFDTRTVINGQVESRSKRATTSKRPQKDMTLAQVRALLLGKRVIIGGAISAIFSPNQKDLLEWSYAESLGARYKGVDAIRRQLPASYLGQEADVIAVQLNAIAAERVEKPNALGEAANEDSIANPYCDVVVRFPDGVIAIHTSYPSLFFSSLAPGPFRLKSEQDNRARMINDQLPSIIGKTVYAAGFSKMFQPTASLEDLAFASDSPQRVFDFPLMRPLKIVIAKYNEAHDLIVLKLKDDEGREYLTSSTFSAVNDQRSFLEHVVSSAPASLVISLADFTPRELAAIRDKEMYVGMSGEVLYYLLGFPEQENNWGRGLKQLAFAGGHLYVYVDASGRIRSWQSLGK